MHAYDSRRHRKKLCKCSEILVEFENAVRIFEVNVIRMHSYEKDRRHDRLIENFLRLKYFCKSRKKSHEEKIVSFEKEFSLVR